MKAKPKKKRYRKPKLVVHGDIRKITMVKRGTSWDGSGKPRTRAAGTNA